MLESGLQGGIYLLVIHKEEFLSWRTGQLGHLKDFLWDSTCLVPHKLAGGRDGVTHFMTFSPEVSALAWDVEDAGSIPRFFQHGRKDVNKGSYLSSKCSSYWIMESFSHTLSLSLAQ